MSGYGAIKQRTADAAQPVRDETRCYANGCPCRASMSLEGGKWMCGAHAFAAADAWPAITEKLCVNSWLVGFMNDLHRIDQTTGKDVPSWREYATKFWTGQDDYCIPHAKEDCLPYQNRMRGELLYRCGLAKRPAPRLAQEPKGRGNAAGLLARRAA